MADTKRTLSALTTLFADNTAGDISAQDLRDFLISVCGSRMITNFTGNSTLTTASEVAEVNSDAGEATITLPACSSNRGKVFTIKRISAGNNVIVARAGSDTIEGATSKTLATQWASVTIIAGTTGWLILSAMGTVT